MPGLISEKDMADLAGSAGAAFDERFAALMIQHQKGALALAKEEKAGGAYGPGVEMADAIIAAGGKHLKDRCRSSRSRCRVCRRGAAGDYARGRLRGGRGRPRRWRRGLGSLAVAGGVATGVRVGRTEFGGWGGVRSVFYVS